MKKIEINGRRYVLNGGRIVGDVHEADVRLADEAVRLFEDDTALVAERGTHPSAGLFEKTGMLTIPK